MQISTNQLAAALTEWDRRYRESPDEFWSETDRLSESRESYGEASAPYLASILVEMGVVADAETAVA